MKCLIRNGCRLIKPFERLVGGFCNVLRLDGTVLDVLVDFINHRVGQPDSIV